MEGEHKFNSTSSSITRHKVDNEILELWQDERASQQRKASTNLPPPPSQPPAPPPQQHLYTEEDEMATWFHYPLEDLYNDLCENQGSPLPPVSSVQQPTTTTTAYNLERSLSLLPELTVVESNSTQVLATMRSVGEVSSAFPSGGGGGGGGEILEKGGESEVTVSSSSGTSGGGDINKTRVTAASEDEVDDKKRKRKEVGSIAQTTGSGQDLEHKADDIDERKQSRGHSTTKKSRSAEVHNLSERRRRDRINERMKALQELIPRCNKSDKASMLDDAIEYLKSLQMQVQMMSTGCNMVPMMYPGLKQYMSPMGMDMGMARPMMPFPQIIPGSNLPTAPGAPARPQFGPRFGILPARMPSVPSQNLSVNQGGNQVVDSLHGSYPVQSPGMTQTPNMGDPYRQFMALQQMQMQMQMQQMQAVQNQAISQPGSSKPSTSKSEAQIEPSTSKSESEKDH